MNKECLRITVSALGENRFEWPNSRTCCLHDKLNLQTKVDGASILEQKCHERIEIDQQH